MRYWTQCLRRVNSFHLGNLFAHEIASIIFGISETVESMLDCAACHTPEQSANYDGNEQLYFEKIIHWREPDAPSDVKK